MLCTITTHEHGRRRRRVIPRYYGTSFFKELESTVLNDCVKGAGQGFITYLIQYINERVVHPLSPIVFGVGS